MKTYNVEIKGIAPLLQHRYLFKDEKDQMAKKSAGRKDYSSEWKTAMYWDDTIGMYEPSNHLEGAMQKAASNFQIPGKGKKTYKDLFKSSVFVTPENIQFGLNGSPDKLVESGKLHIHRALVRVNRAGVERLRPMLKSWSLSFELQVLEDQIEPDAVKQILEYAGRYVGIGDYRPKYGRFTVSKLK